MTKIDKGIRLKRNIFGILSVLITLAPALIFYIKGWILGDTYSKTVMGITFTAALILTVVSLAMKFKCRTIIWVLLIGCYVALGNIKSVLIILTVCTALDEFLIAPMYIYYRDKYKFRKNYREVIKEGD